MTGGVSQRRATATCASPAKVAVRWRRAWPHAPWLLGLALLVLVANAPLLSGLTNCDPETIYGGIAVGRLPGLLNVPACFVDPAPAYFTQPLGFLSAWDWLHGIVPWWNAYSGVGMPLAAEMQNESLFLPFVLLLYFHSGWLIQRVVFQLLCGVFTYAFLIRLERTRLASFTGAALFALNGTFFLSAGTVVGPLFCLPLLLLGIEDAVQAAAKRRMGWSLIVVAVALSLYAGFPEIAYIDGLLGALWASWRLAALGGAARWHLLAKLLLGAGAGVALAAPQLVPFREYLTLGNVGPHGSVLAAATWPPTAAPLQLFPFFYGPLALPQPPALAPEFTDCWTRIGGWFGALPALLALAALLAPQGRQRGQRLVLGFWVLLWEARCFGFPPAISLFTFIPGMSSMDAIRYSGGSMEFAVFVLSAFGLDALAGCQVSHRRLGAVVGLFVLLVAASIIPALPYVATWYRAYPNAEALALAFTAMAAIGALGWCGALARGRGARLASGWMLTAALVTMLMPELGAFRGGHEVLDTVNTLQRRTGLDRLYALGPFSGPFWAQRRVASINYFQLPAPQNWVGFINAHLYTLALPLIFTGTGVGQQESFIVHLPAYEALGIRYVSLPAGVPPTLPDSGGAVPDLTGAAVTQRLSLAQGDAFGGVVDTSGWHGLALKGLNLRMASTSAITALFCEDGHCVRAVAPPPASGALVVLTFPVALPIMPGEPLNFWLGHTGADTASLPLAAAASGVIDTWLASGRHHGELTPISGVAPLFSLNTDNATTTPLSADVGQMRLVAHDAALDVWELPHPAPYAEAAGCTLTLLSRQHMLADCAAPATLLRRELFYPGWAARVNGQAVAVTQAGEIFQQIPLPAGRSTIHFSYLPTHMRAACALAFAALVLWMGGAVRARRR